MKIQDRGLNYSSTRLGRSSPEAKVPNRVESRLSKASILSCKFCILVSPLVVVSRTCCSMAGVHAHVRPHVI